MSPFEEVFGINTNIGDKNDDLSSLIATIRDKFSKEINHYIPYPSMGSSPSCVLFAVYKLLENDLKEKDYISFECEHER